jgi:pilus assembly protein CpaB
MQSRATAILVAIVLAVLATVALVVYARSADQRAIAGEKPVKVLVAAKVIPANTTGEQAFNRGLVTTAELPRKAVAKGAISSVAAISGRVAAVDIQPGEQLLASRWVEADSAQGSHLLPIPADKQAIAIAVDLTRQVSGFVTPGDHVSVVASFDVHPTDAKGDSSGPDIKLSRFLLQDVAVLAVGTQPLPNPGASGKATANKGQTLTTVTLAVKPQDVERVAYAAENGSLYLSLLPPGQRAVPPVGRTITNEF